MKKRLFITAIILMISLSIFSSPVESNRQKIFPVDSAVYRAMKELYISQGYALLSTTGPWSAAELELMLSRIDISALDDAEEKIYRFVEAEITGSPRFVTGDYFGFGIEGNIDGELYLHTNKNDYRNPDEYGLKLRRMYGDLNIPTPFFSLPFETWIAENVYGYMSLDLSTVRNAHSLTIPVTSPDGSFISGYDYNASPLMHNIPFVYPNAFSDFSMNFPFRAFGSIGGSWWNISIGRDKMSWGPGETGNFIIGDQFPYHNSVRVTFFTDAFKYTFSMSAFIHPENYMYYDETQNKWWYSPAYFQNNPREGLRMFISHRLEWRIFNKINMALTEAIMYQNDNGGFDPLVLSPTAIFHNFYIRGNANSLLSLEIDWAVAKHWNLYGQVVLDQLQMVGEYSSAPSEPSALGYMVGTKYSYPMGNGVLYGSAEFVYTDPFLYMRDDGASFSGNKYGTDFIVAFPEFVSEDSTNRTLGSYALQYLGYRYGGDAIVTDIRAGYEVFGKWFAESELMYMIHGCFDELTRWATITSKHSAPSAPSDSEPETGSYDINGKTKNAVSHTLIFTIKGGYEVITDLTLYGRTDLILIWNKNNLKNTFSPDFQITIGISYSI